MPVYLHDIIIKVIKTSRRPLTARNIWDQIVSQKLWKKLEDNHPPSLEQVNARISKYQGFFKRKDGYIFLNVIGNQKLLRLTWNENSWELPSKHKWSKKNQGQSNIAYENQYGFGHEEWLFSPRFKIGEYQYGYIRGLDLEADKLQHLDKAYLYSVKKVGQTNTAFYVGIIQNLQIIKHNDSVLKEIRSVIKDNHDEMVNELKLTEADFYHFAKHGFSPVVRFKWEDVHIIDKPILFDELNLSVYKRFQPFDLFATWAATLLEKTQESNSKFISGKASQNDGYERTSKEYSTEVKKIHSEIINALEIFLSPTFSISNRNISIEKMRFKGNIADVVILHRKDTISIYEIKTSSSARRNIREAIGQLLDYSLHANEYRINELIIVSPSEIKEAEKTFLKSLSDTINFKLSYLEYKRELTPKFIKY